MGFRRYNAAISLSAVSMVSHPVIGGYQLSAQLEIT